MSRKSWTAVAACTVCGVSGLVGYNPQPVQPSQGPYMANYYGATNWAGYVSSAPVYQAKGCWTVRTDKTPSEADQWVGLGGWNTPTILQTGTRVQGHTSWGWVEDYPAYPVVFSFPVNVGDYVCASVTAAGGVVFDDTTNGGVFAQQYAFNATGADADWVVETHSKHTTLNRWAFNTTNVTVNPEPIVEVRNHIQPSLFYGNESGGFAFERYTV